MLKYTVYLYFKKDRKSKKKWGFKKLYIKAKKQKRWLISQHQIDTNKFRIKTKKNVVLIEKNRMKKWKLEVKCKK